MQACDGGEEWRAYEWAMKHGGIMSELNYGPYLGQDAYCRYNKSQVSAVIKSYVNVTSGDAQALKMALAMCRRWVRTSCLTASFSLYLIQCVRVWLILTLLFMPFQLHNSVDAIKPKSNGIMYLIFFPIERFC